MTRLNDIKAMERQQRNYQDSFKLDLFLVFFVNFAVLLISSQINMSGWLEGLALSDAGIFLPLSLSLCLSLVYLIERKRRSVTAERDRFMLESKHDNLTGLYNRQYLHESATIELERTKRVPSTFSVILLDIDNFKNINDQEGHAVGDAVLTQFAQVLEKVVRQIDVVARWGGEEFIVLCRDTDDQGALTVAQKIQASLSQTDFASNLPITASMGVASVDEASSLEDLIKLSDTRMYQAKRLGKNCIVPREEAA